MKAVNIYASATGNVVAETKNFKAVMTEDGGKKRKFTLSNKKISNWTFKGSVKESTKFGNRFYAFMDNCDSQKVAIEILMFYLQFSQRSKEDFNEFMKDEDAQQIEKQVLIMKEEYKDKECNSRLERFVKNYEPVSKPIYPTPTAEAIARNGLRTVVYEELPF